MTSLTSKIKLNIKSQEGVTLLLAILVLASLMAISFSLATILFIEVRSSSDLLRSETSLYGATGVGEEALFNLKRQVCANNDPNCLSSRYPTQFNNNVSLVGSPTLTSTSTPIFQAKVPAYSDFTTTKNKYDFCNVSAGTHGCGYGKVTVNFILTGSSTYPLNAYVCEFDPNAPIGSYLSTPCTAQGQNQGYWLAPSSGSGQVADGSAPVSPVTSPSVSWNLNPNLQQQLIITNNSPVDIFFSVQTFAADGVTPLGLPYVGKTSVVINTQNGALGRKIQVVVPTASGSTSSAGGSSISRVQFNHAYPNGDSLAFNSNTTAGNFIIAIGSFYPHSPTPGSFSCSDSQGNSFTNMPSFIANDSAAFVCFASNIKGGADTVTMSGLGVTNDPGLNVIEYSGIAASNPLDFSGFKDYGSGNPAVTTATSNSFTNSVSDLILAVFTDEVVTQSSITGDSNFSMIQFDGGHIDAEEEWLNAAPQTNNASFNLSNSTNHWAITVLGFKGQ